MLPVCPPVPDVATSLDAVLPPRAAAANDHDTTPGTAALPHAPHLPHVRESGTGPGVVCLHANAGSSAQWRSLGGRLAPRWRCIAADAWGAGRSPAWPGPRPRTLRDEVALLDPVWRRAGDAVAVVGHSYGAATALVAALAMPQRVRALALYEPTLFSLIDAAAPPPNDADGIRDTVARLLAQALPRLQVVEFDGLGHMGPLTHPEAVDGATEAFLEALRGADDGRFVA